MRPPVPAVLSIAGSDSGGGAGIQADLKAFARCGVHGMTAITALTAQSTVGVTAIHPVPGEFIVEQVRAVAEDIGVDAVKIGMLGTADTVRAVREALGHIGDGVPIVIDPVMVAESGAVLLDDEARRAIVTELLPLATVITPNLPEARVLAGDHDDVEDLARALHEFGPANVVVTGGHRDEITDVFFDGNSITLLSGERHPDGAAHGSGLHALELDRGPAGAGLEPGPGGAGGAADRVGGGAGRASRHRPGARAGQRTGRRRGVDGCPADRRDARDIMRA